MLEFEIKNQKLTRLDVVEPATDSEQYLKAKFTVKDDDWNGKAKTAFFRLGEAVYKALLDSSNMCIVPSEVLIRNESKYARTQGSKIFVSLVGEYSTTRITTNEVQIDLNASGYADAEEPKKPTENEYKQILTQYANNEAAISEAKAECETARADLVGVKNIFANAIKGNLSGGVVHADDVSPVEHLMNVNVHGKNLAKRTNANKTETSSGITFTVLEDGRISASGTATSTAYYILTSSTEWAYQLPIQKGVYTIPKAPVDGCRITVAIRENQNAERVLYYSTPTNTVTFEVTSKEARFDMILCVDTGRTVAGAIFEPQLEKGNTATEYEPYVDPSTMTVRRCGKNMFDVGERADYHVIGTNTTISDGVIHGEVLDSNSGHCINLKNRLPNGNVGISFDCSGTMPRIIIKLCDKNGNAITSCEELTSIGFTYNSAYNGFFANTKEIALTIPKYVAYWYLGFVFPVSSTEPVGTIVKVSNVQVEYNDEITSYEKPNITEHTPSADGTVEGITSLSPNMTILTDTEGAIVECEYIKDTNKVIQKIADALNITI